MRQVRCAPLLAAAVVALVGGASAVFAQGVGNVRGNVVEAGTLRPMAGVQVTVPGTGRGALSDGSGNYLINNVPVGARAVRAEMLGYQAVQHPVTVMAGQAQEVSFQLGQVAVAINEIVVTGVPGATSKRTLGNSVSKLDAADLTKKTVVSTVAEMLQSRTPGLTFLQNSGAPGTAGEMRIRGAGSLVMSNMPVVYVDGVRFTTSDYGSFTPSGAGNSSYQGQRTTGLDGIDPNDIESIEVIKGPAAATLYGAEAAAGVINVITKKGRMGQQPLQWDAKVEYGGPSILGLQTGNYWALNIPDNYTTCDATRVTGGSDAANWPGCAGKAVGAIITQNPLRQDPAALRAGMVRRMALSLRGGGDNYSYYIAGDKDDEQGVQYPSYQYRQSVRANFQVSPSNKVDVTAQTSFSRSNIRLPLGDESAEGMLLSAARGRPARVPPGGLPIRDGWGTTAAVEANNYNNTTQADRFLVGSTMNYRPFQWFKNRLTLGLDYTGSFAQVISPPGSVDADYAGVAGLVAQRTPTRYAWTVDYAGNVDKALTQDLVATTSFGAQFMSRLEQYLYGYGIGMGAPDVTTLQSTQQTYSSFSYLQNKSLGFFGQEQLGWKDRLYVTGAVRMDNNSSFGSDINRYTYPKASVAYVASDEPMLKPYFNKLRIDNFKFRAAWGRAGRAPDPYWANQVYTVLKTIGPNNATASNISQKAVGNANLKPEKGQEIEAGFEAGLFQDRGGVDFTYYRKDMKDVLIASPLPASSGFSGTFTVSTTSPYANLGATKNEGFELAVNATPVLKKQFSWDTRVNLSTNRNRLLTIDPLRKTLSIGGQSYGTVQYQKQGYPLAGYWAVLPKYNADTLMWNASTGYAIPTDTAMYIGSSMPTREMGWSNTFTLFRNVRVFAFMDYKGGFYNFNYREYARCRTQLNCQRVNDPANVDVTNMNLVTNPPKNPEVRIWRGNIMGYWIQPADFIKLRDLSLTYTVPRRFLRTANVQGVALTAAAHNLGILWTKYDGMDPEVNSYNGTNYGNTGFARADIYTVPMVRRVTFSANVSF